MCGSDTFRYIDARPGTNPNDGIVWLRILSTLRTLLWTQGVELHPEFVRIYIWREYVSVGIKTNPQSSIYPANTW